MQKIIFTLVFMTYLPCLFWAQTDHAPIPHNRITFSAGMGYIDGIQLISHFPTFGIGYERRLNKRFGINFNILSYYRFSYDSDALAIFDPSKTNVNVSVNGIAGPVISPDDYEKLNKGIRQINPRRIIKEFSMPMDISLSYHPIRSRRHNLAIYLGFSMTYESRNYWRYIYPVRNLTTQEDIIKSGSAKSYFFTVETEFRNFSPGASLKLGYDFSFSSNVFVGIRGSVYNVLFIDMISAFNNDPVWDSSILVGYKF